MLSTQAQLTCLKGLGLFGSISLFIDLPEWSAPGKRPHSESGERAETQETQEEFWKDPPHPLPPYSNPNCHPLKPQSLPSLGSPSAILACGCHTARTRKHSFWWGEEEAGPALPGRRGRRIPFPLFSLRPPNNGRRSRRKEVPWESVWPARAAITRAFQPPSCCLLPPPSPRFSHTTSFSSSPHPTPQSAYHLQDAQGRHPALVPVTCCQPLLVC